jgi:c-di-GMP-binding flagellar brake protein YcgR
MKRKIFANHEVRYIGKLAFDNNKAYHKWDIKDTQFETIFVKNGDKAKIHFKKKGKMTSLQSTRVGPYADS